jgi:uncharacterized protein (TIGR03435 family)
MQDFIMRAFGVRAYQVIGPDWLKRERFDISATMPAGATTAQVPAMLQSLLESRFGLKVRKSQQEFEVYVLVRSKRPFTLTEVQPRDAESTTTGVAPTRSGHGVSLKLARGGLFTFADNKLDGKGMSMEMLANTLTPFVALPIVNASDITGFYDIHLDLAPDDYSSMMARAAVSRGVAYPPEVLSKLAGVSNQSFLDSLDEVGLKLETGKRRLEVINVDAVQTTPTEN